MFHNGYENINHRRILLLKRIPVSFLVFLSPDTTQPVCTSTKRPEPEVSGAKRVERHGTLHSIWTSTNDEKKVTICADDFLDEPGSPLF